MLKHTYFYVVTIVNSDFLLDCIVVNFLLFKAQYFDYFCIFTAKCLLKRQIFQHSKILPKLVSSVY